MFDYFYQWSVSAVRSVSYQNVPDSNEAAEISPEQTLQLQKDLNLI